VKIAILDVLNVKTILITTVRLVTMDITSMILLASPVPPALTKSDIIVMMPPMNATNVMPLVLLVKYHLITVLLVLLQELKNPNVSAQMEHLMMD